jgi:thiopurine S-methyltransferase
MGEDWIGRWQQGNTGWHEASGNKYLRHWWQRPSSGNRVLVPLCGKSLDLLWLAEQGHEVTGVELSPLAIESFFTEHALEFELDTAQPLACYRAKGHAIRIYCGDYFSFENDPFDALFDRGALVALSPELRGRYASHTRSLLAAHASQLLITLDYEQSRVAGPPFAVPATEVSKYWPDLVAVDEFNAIEESPPKFRAAGLTTVTETIWRTA